MSIDVANLGASANPDINSQANQTSYSNSSWTPPTSGLIIVGVISREGADAAIPVQPTMSGNGLTWVNVGTVGVNSERITLFAADASGSSAGATTVDFGTETQGACIATFFHTTGVDLSSGVAGAFVQVPSASNAAGNITSISVTLATASHADNRPFAVSYHRINEATTHRADWTELDDLAGTATARGSNSQYRGDAFETTASASWATAVATAAIIAAELKAAGAVSVVPLRTLLGVGA